MCLVKVSYLTRTLNKFLRLGGGGILVRVHERRKAKCDWQGRAGNRLQQQGGCDDPNGACFGGARVCCRLVSWQSGGCSDKTIDVGLGGVGSGQRFGGAFEGLHRQDRNSNEIRVRPVDELRGPVPQRAQFKG